MVNVELYRKELLDGVRRAFALVARSEPQVEAYSISIWTDVNARKSAVAVDTFENSETKRNAANIFRKGLRDKFLLEGNSRRASLVPLEMRRNNNPADFAFRKLATIENASLLDADPKDVKDIEAVAEVLQSVQREAIDEANVLRLHPDAEIGISGPGTWYGNVLPLNSSER